MNPTSYQNYLNYGQHVSGPGNITNIHNHGQFLQGLILEHIAAKAIHDANNTSFELPKCYPGTREQVHGDLTRWVENIEPRYPIYWLYAPAGSGKTAIAKTFADSCSNSPKRHLLASFFFRRTSLHQNTEERFIPTIAYQLMTNLPQTSHFIADAIIADPAIFQKDLRVQMDKLILDPLLNVCETATSAVRAAWPRLLVIDGLDECSGQAAQLKILDVLSHLVRHTPFPVIFLSCRPETSIRAAFQGEPLSRLSLKTCLSDVYNSDDDIRKFLIGMFAEVMKTHSRILEFPQDWPGEEVIRLLIKKSSGHFIYASTVIKYINVQDDNPIERLGDVMRCSERRSDDQNPFAELDALYKHILFTSVKPKHLPTVVRVLQVTVVQAQRDSEQYPRPVLHCSLASFLGLKSGEVEYSLRNLEGILVERLPDRPSVKFHHASFGDFLLDEDRSGPYFIDISLAYAQLITHLFRHILDEGPVCYPGSTIPNLVVAIRYFLNRLPMVAPTEELHQILHYMTAATVARKIIRNCTTMDRNSLPEWYADLSSWELVARFASALGELAFSDTPTLQHNFLDQLKKYVSRELRKYTNEPQWHLITLFMTGRSIPSQDRFPDHPWHPPIYCFPFILSVFHIDDHVLLSDRTSLNLASLLWTHSESHGWSLLRQLIQEMGFNIKPDAYSATCLCIMKWINGLSVEKGLFLIAPFAVRRFNSVAFDVFSSLQYMRQDLWNGKRRLDICPEAVALWPVFYIFGGLLLGRAGPSPELQKHLIEKEWMIYLLSHIDSDERRRLKMWTTIKAAIDDYLLRNQSSATMHVLDENGSILIPSSSSLSRPFAVPSAVPVLPSDPMSGQSHRPVMQWFVTLAGMLKRPIARVSSSFPTKSFQPPVLTAVSHSGPGQPDWTTTFDNEVTMEFDVLITQSLSHQRTVQCVNFSRDGKCLAAGCGDGKAYIYCVQSGALTCVLKKPIEKKNLYNEYITAVCFIHNEMLATGTVDGVIYIWKIEGKHVRNVFKAHDHWILSFNLSPNGRLLASASRDNTVRVWRIRDGRVEVLTDANSASVYVPLYTSAVFSPDGKYVAASHKDGAVRIWDVRTAQLKRRMKAHADWVYDVAFMPNGRGLVSGSRDTTLKYWDVSFLDFTISVMGNDSHEGATGVEEDTQPERKFLGHKNSVYSIAISPDGRWVASGSSGDSSVRIWNTHNAAMQCILNNSRWILTVDFSPTGEYFASGGYDGTVELWRYSCRAPEDS